MLTSGHDQLELLRGLERGHLESVDFERRAGGAVRDGYVLEDSVGLLKGATVYANHNYFDINAWLGAVSGVAWDPAGANSGATLGSMSTAKTRK